MSKSGLILLPSILWVTSLVAQDTYVRVYGVTRSGKDSSAVSVNLKYEKLPYFDDVGVSRSDEEGNFEFYLIKGLTYSFELKKPGYITATQQFEVLDPAGDHTFSLDLYINPEEQPELMTLENLIFSRGSDQISVSSYRGLDELVVWLNDRPNVIIQLEGHTDFEGNAEANMRLSQSRVDAVKDYLTGKGIKKDRVLTKAFGGTAPLTDERTDEGKTRNRRVEVRIIRR